MLKEYLSSLANAFRSVLGTTEKINAQDFSSKVNEVYEKGKSEGVGGGDTETAYNNGFEAGKQAEYDRFWDSYQDNGNRTNYQSGFAGFGYGNTDVFKPKYSMYPDTINTAFWGFGRRITDIENAVDFVEVFDKRGLTFDTSNCTNFTSAFMWANIKRLGVIDIRKNSNNFATVFAYGKIKTIDKLIVNENNQFMANTFQSQATLENITFEGVIGSDISFKDCKALTHDSLMNIINHLGTVTTTKTLTLHADSKAKLTDAEKAIATQKGWTIA